MPGQLGAEPGARLDEQAVVVDVARGGAARRQAGVDEPGGAVPQVVPAEAPVLDEGLGAVDEGDVGRLQQGADPPGVVGGDDLLVAVPGPPPRQAGVDGRLDGADDPGHGGAEVGQHHARHAARQAEAEVGHAGGHLDHGEAGAGPAAGGGHRGHGATSAPTGSVSRGRTSSAASVTTSSVSAGAAGETTMWRTPAST